MGDGKDKIEGWLGLQLQSMLQLLLGARERICHSAEVRILKSDRRKFQVES